MDFGIVIAEIFLRSISPLLAPSLTQQSLSLLQHSASGRTAGISWLLGFWGGGQKQAMLRAIAG